ncbi:MAG: hypothetical protein WCR06_01045, partial [bacterium]
TSSFKQEETEVTEQGTLCASVTSCSNPIALWACARLGLCNLQSKICNLQYLRTRLVAGTKGVEVPFQALPEGGDMGLARSVELHATWVYATRALNLTPALID